VLNRGDMIFKNGLDRFIVPYLRTGVEPYATAIRNAVLIVVVGDE